MRNAFHQASIAQENIGVVVDNIKVGLEGAVVGIDTFGESAPAGVLFKYFGFTTENVIAKAKAVLGK